MQKETRFKELIEHQQESGLTIKEFCSNQNIVPSTFHYWKKKLTGKPGKKDFIPLVIKSESANGTSHHHRGGQDEILPSNNGNALIEIVYPNGTKLRVRNDLDLVQLRALVHLYD